ncbi:MAG: cytochrome C [Rhodopseudomonas palustris]|uniref:Cytochrome C n=1 Tax=Rhodopseudomonas palustris TaxID=1076 RepID=A0A933S2R1_RHOPL|nr:cytochrome C [Rhodopseudomonas palustris]
MIMIAGLLAATATPSAAESRKKPAKPVPAPLIAQACSGCHGQLGQGLKGTPRLSGYEKDAFARVWSEFRDNQRPAATIMPRIARGYSDTEVAVLANYFSSIRR